MVFEINQKSFADHILSGKYKINKKEVTEDWTDANGRKHKNLICYKVSGSVDMFFRTEEEFNDFSLWVQEHKSNNLSNKVKLTTNNTAEDVMIDAFLKYEPVRARDGMWKDYMLRYTMTIEER